MKAPLAKTKSAKPRGRGRPSVRTANNVRIICGCVERGMPFTFAAQIVGISLATLHEWKGSDESFRAAIDAAVARGVEARLQKIEKASRTDWRAAAWLLEHCTPEHFAKSRLELTGAGGAPLTVGIGLLLPPKATDDAAPAIPVLPNAKP